MPDMTQHQRLLIIDFGSQVTQLIARRLRELNVYCEIHPFNAVDDAFLKDFAPQAVILSQVTFGIAVRMAVMSILAGN